MATPVSDVGEILQQPIRVDQNSSNSTKFGWCLAPPGFCDFISNTQKNRPPFSAVVYFLIPLLYA